jgi:DNA-binding transcriptional regulator YiaG
MDAANITCPELSRRLQVSRNTPHLWRSGKRYPSRALQPKLAKLLGVSVAKLNGWAA